MHASRSARGITEWPVLVTGAQWHQVFTDGAALRLHATARILVHFHTGLIGLQAVFLWIVNNDSQNSASALLDYVTLLFRNAEPVKKVVHRG